MLPLAATETAVQSIVGGVIVLGMFVFVGFLLWIHR